MSDWLSAQPPLLEDIATQWFGVIRACGDDVLDLMHDGFPHACVEDAAFAYVNVFTAHVNVGFFQGAELDDPHGLLQGTGKYMRHVKIKALQEVDETALATLIAHAYEDVKLRLARGDE